jgi:hypothetical protein
VQDKKDQQQQYPEPEEVEEELEPFGRPLTYPEPEEVEEVIPRGRLRGGSQSPGDDLDDITGGRYTWVV